MTGPDRQTLRPRAEQVALARTAYEALRNSAVEQDELTGRFLTAIAFFLTAGTAGLALDDVRNATFEFSNGVKVQLPALFLSAFLVLSAISAIYLVLSFGPHQSWQTPYVDKASFLSFMEVAEATPSEWREIVTEDDPSSLSNL